MTDKVEEVQIDRAMLTSVVRKALRRETIQLQDWRRQALHSELGSGASVSLISGVGRDCEKAIEWAIVLKIVSAPPLRGGESAIEFGRDVTDHNYWKREPLIYQSGLLQDVGGLSAARCYGVVERSAEVAWIWLEAIVDTTGTSWPLDRYGISARHLGQFNGAYLAGKTVPAHEWLSHEWLPAWLNRWTFMVEFIKGPQVWKHHLVRRAFPDPILGRLLNVWNERETLMSVLRSLPQTFCHRDANRSNMFARDTPAGAVQTVVVDWAFAGIGAVGEDIGQLVASSLLRAKIKASEIGQLDQIAFAEYVEGLRDVGWRGDPRIARLGYAASAALRWAIPGLFGIIYALAESQHGEAERKFGLPIEALMEQWGNAVYFLLDLADEARDLRASLGGLDP